MIRPMPSPRGTNRERLYIRTRGPVAAYDSVGGLASGGVDDETVEKIVEFLRGKLSADDFESLKALLAGAADDPDGAMDDPFPFPGRPEPGGTMTALDRALAPPPRSRVAMDALGGWLPHLARIGVK